MNALGKAGIHDGVKETSVIFAAILGAALLQERMGRWRIAGALLVALGAASIRWS